MYRGGVSLVDPTAVRSLVRAERGEDALLGHKTHSVFRPSDIVSSLDLKDAARRYDDATARTTTRAKAP